MTREQGQVVRLLLMCAAWALGETLLFGLGLGLGSVDLVIPAALAVGVYLLTEDLARGGYGGGGSKYWRGRRVDGGARDTRDDDEKRRGGRWN